MLSFFRLLIAAFVAAGAVQASNGPGGLTGTTPTAQKRSYQSGGSTCYYICPPRANNGAALSAQGDSRDYDGVYVKYCGYGDTECYYEANGDVSQNNYPNDQRADSNCPARAAEGGCGSQPNNGFRKRKLASKLSPAEKRIAALQYKPKRSKRLAL